MMITHICCLAYKGKEKLNFFCGKVKGRAVDLQTSECEIVAALSVISCVLTFQALA